MEYKSIGNEIYNITIRQMFRNKIQIKWNKFSDVKYPAWRLNRSVKWIKWRGKSEFVLVSHGSSHLWSNSSSGSGICSWIQVLDYQSNGDEVERDFFKDERKNVVRLYFIAARLLAGNDSSTISSTLVYDVSENDRVNDITKRLLSAKLS